MSSHDASVIVGVLDELIARFCSDSHAHRLAIGRAEYEGRRGRVFEDEELWEAWSQAFLEWYVLEKVHEGDRVPLAVEFARGEPDPIRAEAARALATSHRSVFEVVDFAVGSVRLVDLIGGAEFEVEEKRALHGVSSGDVVEARLVGFGGVISFARTFCFHPAGTRDAIVEHIARLAAAQRTRLDIIDFLAGLRVRCERYQQVPPLKIYSSAD